MIAAAALLAFAATAPSTAQAGGADSLAWTPFRWVETNIGGRREPRAAMMVPLRLDGIDEELEMQLDLGAPATLLYGRPYGRVLRAHGLSRVEVPSAVIDGTLGGAALRGLRVRVQPDYGDGRRTVGTVGADFFEGRVLVIDFPNARLAVLDPAAPLPPELAARTSFVPIDYRNQKLFIPVTLGDSTYRGFFYDTGSSAFPLATTRALWRSLTGRSGDEPDNDRFEVSSWGRRATAVGARASGEMRIGAARLERPMVYFWEGVPQLDFATWPFPVEGLFGNAPFFGRTIVVDLPHRRFGIVDR
jgi:hypothetical protein